MFLLRAPGQLRVRLRHLWCFFGCGVCSLLLFTFCYFQAMSLMSLSAAAILFGVTLLLRAPVQLRVRLRHLW